MVHLLTVASSPRAALFLRISTMEFGWDNGVWYQ